MVHCKLVKIKSSDKEDLTIRKSAPRQSPEVPRTKDQRSASPKRLRPLFILSAVLLVVALWGAWQWWSARSTSEQLVSDSSQDASTTGSKRVYGISLGDSFARQSLADIEEQLQDIKDIGFTDVRFTVSWYIVQPENAKTYDWKLYDKLIKAVHEADLNGLAIVNYTPAWARSSACSKSAYCVPAQPKQYANFAADVAKRYAPQGLHQYEVWNEPNIKSFWQPSPSAAAYTELLVAAYPAIKAADSKALVVSGSLSGVSVASSGYIEPRDYLRDMYAAGAQGSFDVLGYHAYTFPDKPDDQDGGKNAWSKMVSVQPSLRSSMAANGDGDKKIWVTEIGAPTNGPGTAAGNGVRRTASSDHVDEALQAEIAAQVLQGSQKLPWLGAVFWYTYRDKSTKTDSPENFYGLQDYEGGDKPAMEPFRNYLGGRQP